MMNRLQRIYEDIYGPIDKPGKRRNLEDLSRRMAQLVGRREAWTYHALNGAMNGQKGFIITREMGKALDMITTQLEQTHPLQALLIEITAFSVNGAVAPGSVITGASRRCACGLLFVPHHPRQKWCTPECPARKPKAK